MFDQEPCIIVEVVGHPTTSDGDDISASPNVSSKLESLTQSLERLVQSVAADADLEEHALLEEGEVFVPSLSVSGENPTSNTSETEAKIKLSHEDLFNCLETCGADISMGLRPGLATRINTACAKNLNWPKKRFKSIICLRLPLNFGMICPITPKDENWGCSYQAYQKVTRLLKFTPSKETVG